MRPCVVLLLVSVVLGQGAYSPPPNSKIVAVNGRSYYEGSVYLSAHEDTVTLKTLGFRGLAFEGRSVRCVKYHAQWPKTADLSALPKCVSGLDYDLLSEATADDEDGGYITFYDPDGKLAVWDTRKPLVATRSETGKIQISYENDEAVQRLHAGKLTSFDPDDIYMIPRDGAKDVSNMPTGTFMFMPVEGETIHKPENVGDKKSRNPGLFRLTPESTYEATSLQRQYYYRDGPATGSTFQSALPSGDQYWLRAGQPLHYQAISPSEYLRQQNRRQR
jgi:hypothetical protein